MTEAWVERWLSQERFATYLAAAAGDAAYALRLYEWNACVSAALLHDLAHLEVGLRNAFDRALRAARTAPWTDDGAALFAPQLQVRAGQQVDVNERFRTQLAEARRNAGTSVRGAPAHGDVVAQLGFGFWRYLVSRAHEKRLWVPLLHKAFPPGTDRRAVDEPLTRLHKVRNRVAHHEPLLRVDLRGRLDDVVGLARLLDPELGRYLCTMSSVAAHVARRPRLTR